MDTRPTASVCPPCPVCANSAADTHDAALSNPTALHMPEPPAPPPPPGAFVATVVPDESTTARIGVPVDGQVATVTTTLGTHVRANDVLATIRPSAPSPNARHSDGGVTDVEVRATRSGEVIEVAVAPGAEVDRDPRRAMFVVSDLSHVGVEASVPEARFVTIRPGAPVAVRLAAFPDQMFAGRVARVSPTLDPQTHAGTIYLVLENPDGSVVPGMSGFVQITEAH